MSKRKSNKCVQNLFLSIAIDWGGNFPTNKLINEWVEFCNDPTSCGDVESRFVSLTANQLRGEK